MTATILRFDAARLAQLDRLIKTSDSTPLGLICRAHLVEEKLLRGGYTVREVHPPCDTEA